MASATATDSPEGRNTLFGALANHRRRFTLYACEQDGGQTTLSDVAEQVAAWEYNKSVQAVTSQERKRIYTSLQQHHLPKLQDAGLIEFDGDTITMTEKANEIDLYLEIVTEDTIPWSLYYLGLCVVGIAALGIAHVAEFPLGITAAGIGVGFVGVVALSAIGHHVDTRRKHLDAAEIPVSEEH